MLKYPVVNFANYTYQGSLQSLILKGNECCQSCVIHQQYTIYKWNIFAPPTPFLILKIPIYTYNIMCSWVQPIVTQFRYFPLDYERLYDDDVALLGKIKLSFITVAGVTGEND